MQISSPPPQTEHTPKSPPNAATAGFFRAILIGIVGVAITAILVTQAEMVLSSLPIGSLQLPPVAIGLLIIAICLNGIGQRLSRRLGLRQTEMLVVYIMMLVAAMVSSHGVAEKLVPLLVIPNYFANISNGWNHLFGANTPSILVPYKPTGGPGQSVTVDYYEKLPRGQSVPWHAWVTPMLTWGIMVSLVLFGFLCLASLLRRAWVDNEKLSFPLTQLPIQMTAEGSRSLIMLPAAWVGISISVVFYAINGIHQVMPSFPSIPVVIVVNDYFTTPPWNNMGYTPALLSFAAIGFFYLLPQDILFSIWVFFVLSRLAEIGVISQNIDPSTAAAAFKFQTVGAYIALVGTMMWTSREHWTKVTQSVRGKGVAEDADELLPYRTAFYGLIGSILLGVVWLWIMGMSPWLAVLELVVTMLIIAPIMARCTAEAGLLMTETTFRPIDLYSAFAPVHGLGAVNLTIVSFFESMFARDQRGLILTAFLDALRIADAVKMSRRRLLPAFGIAVTVAVVVSVALNIVLPYHIGGLNMDTWMEQQSSRLIFKDDAAMITGNVTHIPSWATVGAVLLGAAITILLYLSRTYCYWWPLHPLGYALIDSWSMIEFWFPCLVAWVLKSVSVRYGGRKLVSKATPFFLGLIVGEFGMAVFYAFLNIFAHVPPPPFP